MPGSLSRWLAVAACCLASWAGAEPELKRWTQGATPGLVLADLGGRRVDLADLRGRVVLVNFWATWCEPCRDEMPSLERVRARFAGRPFEVLAVNYGESRPKVAQFAERYRIAFPVLLDPDQAAAQSWEVKGLPKTFIVDARGAVRYWTFGERDWNQGPAIAVIEALLAETAAGKGGT